VRLSICSYLNFKIQHSDEVFSSSIDKLHRQSLASGNVGLYFYRSPSRRPSLDEINRFLLFPGERDSAAIKMNVTLLHDKPCSVKDTGVDKNYGD
jgi:hypothetical protein